VTEREYKEIEGHMLSQMRDSAHDKYHIYRVLNAALDISGYEVAVDPDVLIAACLLHDIGRERQFQNMNLCHALLGGDMAYEYLIGRKWSEGKAEHVKKCIASHRYRGDNPPESIEAKILFDADKLDASGAMGIARTLIYEGQVGEPLYMLDQNGKVVTTGGEAEHSSFFQEYGYKLEKVYGALHTARAKALALERQKTAVAFYNGLYGEVSQNHQRGLERLSQVLTKSSGDL